MSLSGIKKGSKFGFANAINKTVKPQSNQNNPANQAGQGSPAEKTVVQEEHKVTPVVAAPEVLAAPAVAEEKPAVEVKTETAAETVANDTTPEEVVVEEVKEQTAEPTLETVPTEKAEKKPSNKKAASKAGRKAVLGECKKLNIAIPMEMIEEMENAALILHKGNLNSYIRSCIKKDLKENKKTYEKMKELLKFNEDQ